MLAKSVLYEKVFDNKFHLFNHSDIIYNNINNNIIFQKILTPCFQIIQLFLMTAYFPQTW